jgi:hypothetical protein
MKKLITLLLLALISSPFFVKAQNATTIYVYHLEEIFEVPCTGDQVLLEGDVLVLDNSSWNDQHYVWKLMLVPRNITGTNVRTGQKYHFVGSEHIAGNWSNVDGKHTFREVIRLNLIGQGKDSNYNFFNLVVQAYNRNGELIVDIDEMRTTCR